MKLTFLFATTLVFVGLLTSAVADTDPLQTFSVETVAGAKKLHHALADTNWLYHYAGRDFPIRFAASGMLDKFEWWPGVRWRIIGGSEVVLDNPDGKAMLLRFNAAVTTFQCRDWDGSNATGSLSFEEPFAK